MTVYYSDGEHKTTAEGAIGMSNKAILVITKGYIDDLMNANSKVAIEVRLMKEYKTPAILLFFDSLSEQEKKAVKELLAGLQVVKEFNDVPRNSFDKWLKEVFSPWIRSEENVE